MKYIKLFEAFDKQAYEDKLRLAKQNVELELAFKEAKECIKENDYDGFVYILENVSDRKIFNERYIDILARVLISWPLGKISNKTRNSELVGDTNSVIFLKMLDYILPDIDINDLDVEGSIGADIDFSYLKELVNRGLVLSKQDWRDIMRFLVSERTNSNRAPDLKIDDTMYWTEEGVDFIDWIFTKYPEQFKNYTLGLPKRLEDKYKYLKRGGKADLLSAKIKQ